jgi:hypothetical protein
VGIFHRLNAESNYGPDMVICVWRNLNEQMQEVSVVSTLWRDIAGFIGIDVDRRMRKDFPHNHLRALGLEKLRKYLPPRPTPHNPEECGFCKKMADDDLGKESW